ncbi:MAG: hypothetical protein HY089_11735 [Ignavibacteriales bacterium]|nr:hypothetical protein [Ignavibacteriales bacterium]
MKKFLWALIALVCVFQALVGQEKDKKEQKSSNLIQFYSGKFGLYQGSDGLNNGLFIGVDGITEFIHYNFFLSGAIELYPKQTIGIFKNAPPAGYQQSMILLPLHVNFGYKLFEVSDADTRGYLGIGGGYYFFFYNVDYQNASGGILGGGLTGQSESNTSGNVFASVFARVLIGQIFIEPRFYFAAKKEATVGNAYTYVVNPSGFSLTLGFQYH